MASRSSSRSFWAVLGLCALPLLGFWAYGLFDLDEGFYAAVVSEMLRRGDWITPHYNGEPWFEKPILLYWAAAPCVAVFGEAIGPRLPSVLATLGLCLVLYRFVHAYINETVALLAMAVYGSSLLVVGVGRMMLTDALLVLCLSAAFLTYFRSLGSERTGRDRALAGFFLGLSVLAKGPVGIVLFVGVASVYAYWQRERPRGGWPSFAFALAAGIAIWYVPAWLVNGDRFVQDFLIKQNVQRFVGGDAAHAVSGAFNWVFYVAVLLVGMAPWSLYAVGALRPGQDRFLRFCVTWFGVVFVFYTLGGSKLPHYVLAAVPPLAILIADRIGRTRPGARVRWAGVVATTVVIASLANAAFIVYYRGIDVQVGGRRLQVSGFHAEIHDLARWVRTQGGSVAAYQMPRRSADRGTGGARLMETSHPSLVFYLDQPVLDTDDLGELLAHPGPVWVLTRAKRITSADIERARAAGRKLAPVQTPMRQDVYRVYRLF